MYHYDRYEFWIPRLDIAKVYLATWHSHQDDLTRPNTIRRACSLFDSSSMLFSCLFSLHWSCDRADKNAAPEKKQLQSDEADHCLFDGPARTQCSNAQVEVLQQQAERLGPISIERSVNDSGFVLLACLTILRLYQLRKKRKAPLCVPLRAVN